MSMSVTYRIFVLATVLGVACASQAVAEFKYETRNGGTTLIYGQFDPGNLSFDDGVSTTSEIVDNTNANSRVGFWYRKPTDTGAFSIIWKRLLVCARLPR